MKNNIFTDYKIHISNFSHLAFGEFSSKAFGFLTTVYLARVLGAEQFGQYSWVMAVYAYAYMMANFGFETHGTRTIAQRPSHDFISGILVLRFIYATIVFAFVIFLNTFILPKFNFLLILQSASLLLLPFNTQYIFRGLNKAKYDGLSRMAQAGLFFLMVYVFVEADKILLLPVVWFVVSAITLVSFYLLMRKIVSYTFSLPALSFIKTILIDSLPVGIASALILLYLNFDTILLGFYVDNQSVGLYSVAFKIYYFGYSFLALYYIAFLPSLSRKNDDRYRKTQRNYILPLFLLAAALVLIGIFLSEYIIVLLYGEHYLASISVMKILFFSLAAACVNFAFMNPLQAMGKDAFFIKILMFRTILFVIFCLILISKYGIMGAAYSTLVAEVVTIPGSIILFKNVSLRNVPF